MDATRRRRRNSASSIQLPITTIEIAATTGAARTTRSGASTPCAPSTSAASTRIPTVCDTLTDSPSPTAWSGRPRVPTRYAAISVLPCPGVRAWPAPRAAAVNNDTSRITGVRSAERKIDGRSPVPTPPGTPATAPGLATAAGAEGSAATPTPAPSTGLASATSNGDSVGPPSVATTDIEACASGRVSNSAG